jgi:hypothetical protein
MSLEDTSPSNNNVSMLQLTNWSLVGWDARLFDTMDTKEELKYFSLKLYF